MDDPKDAVFDEVREFPDSDARRRYGLLVGLDSVKERLEKEAGILIDPRRLEVWCERKHGTRLPALDYYSNRPPLFIFAGDVGTGKTILAENFGDAVARQHNLPVRLYSLGLASRGSGAVGEMTRLIGAAFAEIRGASRAAAGQSRAGVGHILLIDEADALVQSRELSQMHHEDRAGVNAVIRGIDDLAEDRAGVLVVMCTNRLEALDPAVRRRAAAEFVFERPTAEQRRQVLAAGLAGANLSEAIIEQLVVATGEKVGEVGFTYSDLTQRLLPSIVLKAYPDKAVSGDLAIEVARSITATAAFGMKSHA